MIEAYPLQWPVGYKRTIYKSPARFDTTFAVARDMILREIKLLGGSNPIISTNIPLRRDGLPYATFSKIDDTGVAVYFTYNKETFVFACDKWNKVEDNMQAIRKAIEAIRGLDRWGVSEMLKRAFTGFKALPEQVETNIQSWYDVLGISQYSNGAQIKEAYRRKAMEHHPDKGGDARTFHQVTTAYEQGMSQLND